MATFPISHLATLDFHIQDITVDQRTSIQKTEYDCDAEGIPHNLLCFILSGSMKYVTESEAFIASAGTVLLIPQGTRYRSFTLPSDDEAFVDICIGFHLLDKENHELRLQTGLYRDWVSQHSVISGLFDEIGRCSAENPSHIIKQKSFLLQILSLIIFGETARLASGNIVSPAIAFIQQNYCENVPVKTYADQCNMSESYFRKKFVEYVGKSPLGYRNELRFAKARKMHAEGYSMQEIADSIGFFDANYFSKLYKKHYGHSLRDEKK